MRKSISLGCNCLYLLFCFGDKQARTFYILSLPRISEEENHWLPFNLSEPNLIGRAERASAYCHKTDNKSMSVWATQATYVYMVPCVLERTILFINLNLGSFMGEIPNEVA